MNRPSRAQLTEEILKGNRLMLSRAITLAESTLPEDRALIISVLKDLFSNTGRSLRLALSGTPGAGKSTLINVLGQSLTSCGFKVAVLSIDPSSPFSRGSILGDKTRMEELSKDPKAYIRPASAGKILGGIASATRESILLCEAAGFEIVIVETVGVGQSEFLAADLTDAFFLIVHTGGGDELQGIKRGILEIADAVIINKADFDNLQQSKNLKVQLQHALDYSSRQNPVNFFLTSAIEHTGIEPVTAYIKDIHAKIASEEIQKRRKEQKIKWFYADLKERVWVELCSKPSINQSLKAAEKELQQNDSLAVEVIEKFVKIFSSKFNGL